jgi:nicotinamide-nucleotide amidase
MNETPNQPPDPVAALVERLALALEPRGWRLATAESCTGGLVASACTERAGSSSWFECGVVSYSNAAKTRLLGVPAALIERHGAVSLPVAEAMARGAQTGLPPVNAGAGASSGCGSSSSSAVQTALAITGVAGPGGGSVDKPVGTVCLAWAVGGRVWSRRCRFDGDRAAVRLQSVQLALRELVEVLEQTPAPAAAPRAG